MKSEMIPIDHLLDRKQCAKALSVSKDTVIRMEKRGELRRVQISEARVGYRASDIIKLIEERTR
jgi:predicted DNA-binding transcriptional regulator AlpA